MSLTTRGSLTYPCQLRLAIERAEHAHANISKSVVFYWLDLPRHAATGGRAGPSRHLGGTQRSPVEDQEALGARPGWRAQRGAQARYCRASRRLPASLHEVPGDRHLPVWLEAPETRPAPKAGQASRRAVLVSPAVYTGHGGQDSRENHMRPAGSFHRETRRPLGATVWLPERAINDRCYRRRHFHRP
uniref:Uncharacterized protein n=1 Tax=Trichogramma kaykai TaxID=54128 RepID=A0ABD2WCX9_9HYME